MSQAHDSKETWFGHPRPLARLFTTEMWERFGYYGMRALLILYLTKHFGFIDETAAGLYGAFTALVYLTPLAGGLLADRYLGYKRSVKFGAVLMSIGYLVLCFGGEKAKPYLQFDNQRFDIVSREVPVTPAKGQESTPELLMQRIVQVQGEDLRVVTLPNRSVALLSTDGDVTKDRELPSGTYRFDAERDPFWVSLMFLALTCVIVGNGFFKPNISTMVGKLYEAGDSRRDAGFTIFYMGINLGSLISQFLCPIFQEWIGFWAGFLLAAVGMLCAWALIQFDGGKLKGIGEPPAEHGLRTSGVVFVGALLVIPLIWFLMNNTSATAEAAAKLAKSATATLDIVRLESATKLIARAQDAKPKVPATISVEGKTHKIVQVADQPGGLWELELASDVPMNSLPTPRVVLFASTPPGLETQFEVQAPELQSQERLVISAQGDEDIAKSLRELPLPARLAVGGRVYQVDRLEPLDDERSVLILNRATPLAALPPVQLQATSAPSMVAYFLGLPILGKILFALSFLAVIVIPIWSYSVGTREEAEKMVVAIVLIVFSVVFWTLFEQAGSSLTLFAERNTDRFITSKIEMPAAQTQIFNPLFIVVFAPIFSAMWIALSRRKLEPSIPVKFAIGLMLVGLGFLALVYGSQFANAQFKVGLLWLVLAYLLHSLGELCLSPVGLSMITKLSITRVVGLMMGVWFLSTAMAQYVAGIVAQFASVETVGGQVTDLGKALQTYTSVFQLIGMWSIGFGMLLLLLSPILKRMMHGVR